MLIEPWISEEYAIEGHQVEVPPPTMAYEPIKLAIPLIEIYLDGVRWYYDTKTQEFFPSITTLLGETDTEGKAALQQWRDRVGEQAAAEITQKTADRGNHWHAFAENYVRGKTYWNFLTTPENRRYACALATLLNQKIRRVIASEIRLVSRVLGVAGRTDLIVELIDGRIAVLDFKTARWKPKDGNRLAKYGIQASFYADALTEMTDLGTIDTIVIVQLCPKLMVWQESSSAHWRPALSDRIDQYAAHVNEQMKS